MNSAYNIGNATTIGFLARAGVSLAEWKVSCKGTVRLYPLGLKNNTSS